MVVQHDRFCTCVNYLHCSLYFHFVFVILQEIRDEVDADTPEKSNALLTAASSRQETTEENQSSDEGVSDSALEMKKTEDLNVSIKLNIDTAAGLPDNVTDLVVQYLQHLRLDEDIKAKEAILTLWDFAGQHLYYASHSVFLSPRAVYALVYNLSKDLNATAEPCVRQGVIDIALENPNSETNLESLMAWLVSVHNTRPTTDGTSSSQDRKLTYLRPPVFIVGTNADQPFEDAKKMEKLIQRSILGKAFEKHVIRPFFAVDNTRSSSDDAVEALQKRIMEVLRQEPYMGEEVPIRYGAHHSWY